MIGRTDPDLLPRLHGILLGGGVLQLFDCSELVDGVEWLEAWMEKETVVVKPVAGGGGRGVLILGRSGSGYTVNGRETPTPEFRGVLRRLEDCLVSECIEQAAYSARIFPASLNTIRMLTMWDVDRREPFVAAAVHRFGTSRSAPVDNWSRGGLSARVDVVTGELGRGVSYPAERIVWHERHPETESPIAGVAVPTWSTIVQKILGLARACPFVPYVGWDVAVTDEGFKTIEANNYSDVNLLQVHGPLLSDSRVRRFYERYGVIA